MTVVRATGAALARAAAIIRRGGVVAYPTETVYGLAADALDPAAVGRVIEIKGRDRAQKVSVIVADAQMLTMVVARISEPAARLIEEHWPGPLTLVLPARAGLPPELVNERGGVGVRVSSDPIAAGLVRAAGGPITATSANRSGEVAATTARRACVAGIDLVLDDGPRRGAPSTVAECLGDRAVVLRQGALRIGTIEGHAARGRAGRGTRRGRGGDG